MPARDGTGAFGPRKRAMLWIGHHHVAVIGAGLMLNAAMGTLEHHGSSASGWSFMGVCFTVAILGGWHNNTLCPRCADAPMDGAAKAAKYARRLRLLHWWAENNRRPVLAPAYGYMLLALAATVLCVYVPLGLFLQAIVLLAPLAALAVSRRTHRLLQPWCPQCHWGGAGGITEPSPDVPRTPSATPPA